LRSRFHGAFAIWFSYIYPPEDSQRFEMVSAFEVYRRVCIADEVGHVEYQWAEIMCSSDWAE